MERDTKLGHRKNKMSQKKLMSVASEKDIQRRLGIEANGQTRGQADSQKTHPRAISTGVVSVYHINADS